VKKTLLKMIPYITILVADFYILPWLIRDTGAAMLLMLFVIPLISFACAVAYGFRLGFDFIFPIMVMILFAPTIFIYYNSSAWPYVIAYGVIAFVGMVIGRIFHKK